MCRGLVDEEDVLRRINLLAISDEKKEELKAEADRRKLIGTQEQFEKVLNPPWGVFGTPEPDANAGEEYFGQMSAMFYDGTRKVEPAEIQTKCPNAKLTSLLFFNRVMKKDILQSFDEDFPKEVKKLLGRQVVTIHFTTHQKLEDVLGSEDEMGCVMKAVQMTGCCNPVIVLRDVNRIESKATRQVILDLIDHKNSANFVDRSINVPFDLSNVLFLVEGDDNDHSRVMSNLIGDYLMGKGDPEMERRNFRWMHDSFKPYLNQRLPVGGATILCAYFNFAWGTVSFMQSSFSEQGVIVNNTKCRQEMVDIAVGLCSERSRKLGISADALKKPFTMVDPTSDGGSKGCAIFLSLYSLFTGRRVRHDSAVTGGLTSCGRLSPIGGVNQKTYAVYKCGMRRIVLPGENRKDVEKGVNERLKSEMEFVFVDDIHQLVEEMVEGADEEEILQKTKLYAHEEDVLRRINLLAISDEKKDELKAEFYRRRQEGTLNHFEKVLNHLWGVSSAPEPDANAGEDCDDARRLFEPTEFQTKSSKLRCLFLWLRCLLCCNKAKKYGEIQSLGPVGTIRFGKWKNRNVQGSEDEMGCQRAL